MVLPCPLIVIWLVSVLPHCGYKQWGSNQTASFINMDTGSYGDIAYPIAFSTTGQKMAFANPELASVANVDVTTYTIGSNNTTGMRIISSKDNKANFQIKWFAIGF